MTDTIEQLLQDETVLRHAAMDVTAIAGRGFGLVARHAIPAGFPVLVERPLGVVIQPTDHYDT
jgi:hypothetical protein